MSSRFLPAFLLILCSSAFAQSDSIQRKFSFGAYGELYYSYDFSRPSHREKPAFIYNHKRHHEVNANLLLLQSSFNDTNVRARLGLMTGNYSSYNLSHEPAWARHLYEAQAGIRLSKKQNLWLDAGIMPSHIGFESAISADCPTLTRSMMADNSPYYETGARLSYTSANDKLYLSAWYLNGWQRIRWSADKTTPGLGWQLTYRPSAKMLFNCSGFLGSDRPDSLHAIRQYHNLYLQYLSPGQFSIMAGIDIGRDKDKSGTYGLWYAPIIIVRKELGKKSAMAYRCEYYDDRNQIMVETNTAHGFRTWGMSANFDHNITDNLTWRVEGKWLHSKDRIFADNSASNFSVTTNLTFRW
jgi:hypothetical protein